MTIAIHSLCYNNIEYKVYLMSIADCYSELTKLEFIYRDNYN